MVSYFKICYTAQYPNGKLLEPKTPYMEANVIACSKAEAICKLRNEFPGLKVNVVEDPQQNT